MYESLQKLFKNLLSFQFYSFIMYPFYRKLELVQRIYFSLLKDLYRQVHVITKLQNTTKIFNEKEIN